MSKVIIHGILLEEPSRRKLANGLDTVTLKIEEKYISSYKEVVNVFLVEFYGTSGNCVPTNIRLAGAPVVIVGSITSKEYKGRFYYELRGEQLSIITTNSFVKNCEPTQKNIIEAKSPSFEQNDLAEDELPF